MPSITSVTEIPEGGRPVRSSGISEMETERTLLIVTDVPMTGLQILAAWPGPGPVAMPGLYAPHDDNDKLTCRSVDGTLAKPPGMLHWHFKYKYSSTPIDRERMDREIYPNPLDRPARASGKAARYTGIAKDWRLITTEEIKLAQGETETKTIIGNVTGITTSAGDLYDSLPELDDSRWTLHFEKNYPADELPFWLLEWDPDSVNDADCYCLGELRAPRTLKLVEPQFSDVLRENDVDYRRVSFDIDYNAGGWTLKIPDRGYFCKIAGVLTKIFTDSKGTQPNVPQLLDGAGNLLSGSGNIAGPVSDSTAAVIREGAVYPEENFDDLPIDESSVEVFVTEGDE
jgi:hypothetical protein